MTTNTFNCHNLKKIFDNVLGRQKHEEKINKQKCIISTTNKGNPPHNSRKLYTEYENKFKQKINNM